MEKNMKITVGIFTALAIIIIVIALLGPWYTLSEIKVAIITRFGKPVEKPITTAGLHLKIPFIDKVNYLPKRMRDQWIY